MIHETFTMNRWNDSSEAENSGSYTWRIEHPMGCCSTSCREESTSANLPSNLNDCSKHFVESKQRIRQKKVQFGCATLREYGVTVGAFSAAQDSCPLQLTWQHTQEKYVQIKNNVDSRPTPSLRKLTLKERRKRVSKIQGLTLQSVQNLELESLIEQIQSMTNFYESLISDETEESNESKKMLSNIT
jgi:hypothetical protein